MLFSKMFIPTMKEDPKEAEVVSHKLMLRAGFIRRLSSGIYTWLPLGLRSLRKVEQIIREEMNRKEAQEILMPAVQPKELWVESGRWEFYGKELLRFKDRNDRELCLAPTHEEVITDLVRREVRSYRELPLILYQIQTKFRDEIRPRFGVMRSREFIMKDAYSFDADEAGRRKELHGHVRGLRQHLPAMRAPVQGGRGGHGRDRGKVLPRVHGPRRYGRGYHHLLRYVRLRGEPGAGRGGWRRRHVDQESARRLKRVQTPDKRRVEEVAEFLGVPPAKLVKTLLFTTDKGTIGVLVAGDREINPTKLKNVLSFKFVELADEETIEQVTGGPLGFSGPLGLDIPLFADQDVLAMEDFVVGGNERDVHIVEVNVGRFQGRGLP